MASHRSAPAALIACGFIAASLVVAPRAEAAERCFGKRPTIVGTRDSERLVGTRGDDVIVGGEGFDTIFGRGGNDRICGGGDIDKIYGGRGADRLRSGGAYEDCWDTSEAQLLVGSRGRDIIYGSPCIDEAHGGPQNDQIYGFGNVDLGAENLLGGKGDDLVDALAPVGEEAFFESSAVLSGGPGDDTMHGPGPDTRGGGTTLSYAASAAGVEVDLPQGTATGEGNDTFTNANAVIGSAHDDRLISSLNGGYLSAGDGDDELVGSEVEDGLYAGPGNDVLSGAGGDDWLDADIGDDRISGGDGIDMLTYSDHRASLHVDIALGEATGAGNDVFDGIENLHGGRKDDVLLGDDGPNVLVDCCRAKSSDHFDGRGGDDMLDTDWGDDTLLGGAGNDVLFGDNGDDSLDGGDGEDQLDGSNGRDTCTNGERMSNCEA